MTLEELKQEIAKIDLKASRDKEAAIEQYCFANNPYKVGDIFEDHIGKILIKRISAVGFRYDMPPCCMYYGVSLTKKGEPAKLRDNTRYGWQHNDINKKH